VSPKKLLSFAAISSALLGPIALAAPSHAARQAATVRVRVVGISRSGARVHAAGVVAQARDGATYQIFGNRDTLRMPPGRYVFAGAVPTFRPGSTIQVSETLVVRRAVIRSARTVALSAATGRLLRTSVNAKAATLQSQTAVACLGAYGGAEIPAAAQGGPGVRVYATPIKASGIRFSYVSAWQNAAGTYQLTGSRNGGIPARLAFRVGVSSLAKIRMVVRGGTDAAVDQLYWNVVPHNRFSICDESSGFSGQSGGPFKMTLYRTPGAWQTRLESSRGAAGDGFWYMVRTYRAGHRYTNTFNAAVVGPRIAAPAIDGNLFRFDASDLFDTPLLYGSQCCARSTIVLRTGGQVVRRATRNTWRGRYFLQTVVRRHGWYEMTVRGTRWSPYGPEPSNLLSPRVSVTWRFHVDPTPPGGVTRAFPVMFTTYQPEGLNIGNAAPPGARTPVRVTIARAGPAVRHRARYRIRTLRVQASSDGGKTWHDLRISRHGGGYLVVVPDPAHGFVSLRSVVTDVRGDAAAETIYRAYGVA